jgi:hypothetical protein
MDEHHETKMKSKVSEKESLSTLKPELYDVLAQLNSCDMLLYEIQVKEFEKYMKVLEASPF